VYKKIARACPTKPFLYLFHLVFFFWFILIPVTSIVLETLENVPSHENVVFYFLLSLIFSFCILLLINYLIEWYYTCAMYFGVTWLRLIGVNVVSIVIRRQAGQLRYHGLIYSRRKRCSAECSEQLRPTQHFI